MTAPTVEILDISAPIAAERPDPAPAPPRRWAAVIALAVAVAVAASGLVSSPAASPPTPPPPAALPATPPAHSPMALASVSLGADLRLLSGPSALTSSGVPDEVWVLDRGSLSSVSGLADADGGTSQEVTWWGRRLVVAGGGRVWALPKGLAGDREALGEGSLPLASSDARWAWVAADGWAPVVRATRLDAASGDRATVLLERGEEGAVAVGDGLLVPDGDGEWSFRRPGEAARPVTTAAGRTPSAGRGSLAFLRGPSPLEVTVVDVLADRVVASHDYGPLYAGLRLSGICPSPDGSRYIAVFGNRWAVIAPTNAPEAQPLTGLRLGTGWSLAWSGPDQVLHVWVPPVSGDGGELRALDLAAPPTRQELVVAELEGKGSWAVSTPGGSCPPGGSRPLS